MSLTCKIPDCGRRTEGTTGLCATHNRAARKAPVTNIRKVGEKLMKQLSAYEERRRVFLHNKRCAVYPSQKATEVHHMKGRIGKLLMDERFWLPVCRKAHVQITNDSAWAVRMGYSVLRTTKTEDE